MFSTLRLSAIGTLRSTCALIVIWSCATAPRCALADQPQRFSFWAINRTNSTVTKYVRIGSELPAAVSGATARLTYLPAVIVATKWVEDDPAGQRIYIGDAKGLVVWQYIGDQSGHLTPMIPPSVPAGRVLDMRLDATETVLYVLRPDGPTSFKVRSNGSLRALQAASAPVDSLPDSMAVSPGATNLYVAGTGGKVPGGGRRSRRSSPEDPEGSISQVHILASDGSKWSHTSRPAHCRGGRCPGSG